MSKNTGMADGRLYEWDYDESADELRILCTKCEKIDTLTGDKAVKFNSLQSAQKYTCLSCWKKNKDAEKNGEKLETQDRISYAQAFNLAAGMVSGAYSDEVLKEEILKWQKWFYKQLTNRNND